MSGFYRPCCRDDARVSCPYLGNFCCRYFRLDMMMSRLDLHDYANVIQHPAKSLDLWRFNTVRADRKIILYWWWTSNVWAHCPMARSQRFPSSLTKIRKSFPPQCFVITKGLVGVSPSDRMVRYNNETLVLFSTPVSRETDVQHQRACFYIVAAAQPFSLFLIWFTSTLCFFNLNTLDDLVPRYYPCPTIFLVVLKKQRYNHHLLLDCIHDPLRVNTKKHLLRLSASSCYSC